MDSSNGHVSGIAPLKAEFLIQDHVRELNLDFVAAKDKKRASNEGHKTLEGPLPKKLKGQNKKRPRIERIPKSDKLCFKIGIEGNCPFGDTCCYSHDVAAYLSNKPPDISSTCYNYQTLGNCPYSFSCRFGSDHIKDGKNLTKDYIAIKYKDQKLYTNALAKDIQMSLRKRSYNFKKSDEASRNFSKLIDNLSKASKTLDSQKSDTEKTSDVLVRTEEQNCSNSEGNDKVLKETNEHFSLSNKESLTDNLSIKDNLSSLTSTTSDTSYKNFDDTLLEPEVKKIIFKDKLYLAPLTTVGNLPFRRICKEFGADITCSEMSLALSLLQGQQSEWALIKRHHTEDIFGIQLCGSHADVMTRCCQVLQENVSFDFIDINMGCPIDSIYRKGAGCGIMNRMKKLRGIIYGVSSVISVPLTLKMRTGIYGNCNIAHNVIEKIKEWKSPLSLITVHGRSREQRYTKSANWSYIGTCNKLADPIPMFGNGDILSYEDYNMRREESGVSGAMIARGALYKPWLFKEIKEQKHLDIPSSERFDILRKYTNYGLEHWGSDSEGVEKTRRFLLEWLSFLYRYIPVGLLERLPQRINERPPPYFGRDDLETLMASPSCSDWIKISEMLLGPVPENFIFLPKHKANAYK